MIAPDWAITAYHCVGQYPRVRAFATIWENGEDEPPTFHDYNACYMLPFTRSNGEVIDGCGDGYSDVSPERHDLALVHLEAPVRGLPFRSIAPARGCGAGDEFPFAFRGEGTSGYLDNRQKIATYETGIRRSSGAGDEGFRGLFDMPTLFERGDSGGGFTHFGDDESGPVLGMAISIARFGDPARGNGLLFWEPSNIEWIWSVLDASGVCDLGSGPCVLREPIPAGGSVCGDGHCTGAETYSLCPAECSPALPDADGDGLPDMRDLCPYLDARTLSADRIVDGNHIDSDQNRLGDDCTPVDCDVTCGPDPDRDGVPSPCDICPDAWDPEQLDTDGDGIGDGCDNCPFVNNPDQMNSDGDPRGDACDNCPGLTNPLQMNCNAEAEATFPDPAQPQGYGDICDPVPCGDTILEARVTNEVIGGRPGRAIRMDQLQVDALASEPLTASAGFRFCRCPDADADDIETRQICEGRSGTLGGCTVGDIEAYDVPNEDQPWRQSAVDYRDTPTIRLDDDLDGLRREAVLQYTPLTRVIVIPPGGVPEDGTLGPATIGRARWPRRRLRFRLSPA